MGIQYKRSTFRTNKFQKQILLPIYTSTCIAFFMIIICFDYLIAHIGNVEPIILGFKVSKWNAAIPCFIFVSAMGLLVATIFWAYISSNKMLAPYERIKKELREIVEGKRKGPLMVRKEDELIEGLLEEINALIKKYLPILLIALSTVIYSNTLFL